MATRSRLSDGGRRTPRALPVVVLTAVLLVVDGRAVAAAPPAPTGQTPPGPGLLDSVVQVVTNTVEQLTQPLRPPSQQAAQVPTTLPAPTTTTSVPPLPPTTLPATTVPRPATPPTTQPAPAAPPAPPTAPVPPTPPSLAGALVDANTAAAVLFVAGVPPAVAALLMKTATYKEEEIIPALFTVYKPNETVMATVIKDGLRRDAVRAAELMKTVYTDNGKILRAINDVYKPDARLMAQVIKDGLKIDKPVEAATLMKGFFPDQQIVNAIHDVYSRDPVVIAEVILRGLAVTNFIDVGALMRGAGYSCSDVYVGVVGVLDIGAIYPLTNLLGDPKVGCTCSERGKALQIVAQSPGRPIHDLAEILKIHGRCSCEDTARFLKDAGTPGDEIAVILNSPRTDIQCNCTEVAASLKATFTDRSPEEVAKMMDPAACNCDQTAQAINAVFPGKSPGELARIMKATECGCAGAASGLFRVFRFEYDRIARELQDGAGCSCGDIGEGLRQLYQIRNQNREMPAQDILSILGTTKCEFCSVVDIAVSLTDNELIAPKTQERKTAEVIPTLQRGQRTLSDVAKCLIGAGKDVPLPLALVEIEWRNWFAPTGNPWEADEACSVRGPLLLKAGFRLERAGDLPPLEIVGADHDLLRGPDSPRFDVAPLPVWISEGQETCLHNHTGQNGPIHDHTVNSAIGRGETPEWTPGAGVTVSPWRERTYILVPAIGPGVTITLGAELWNLACCDEISDLDMADALVADYFYAQGFQTWSNYVDTERSGNGFSVTIDRNFRETAFEMRAPCLPPPRAVGCGDPDVDDYESLRVSGVVRVRDIVDLETIGNVLNQVTAVEVRADGGVEDARNDIKFQRLLFDTLWQAFDFNGLRLLELAGVTNPTGLLLAADVKRLYGL